MELLAIRLSAMIHALSRWLTGEGRYPAMKKIYRAADKTTILSHLRGKYLIIWIPAFAG
jgi:hypothetical protein